MLDEDKIPEQIEWNAIGSTIELTQQAKGIMLAFCNSEEKIAMRIYMSVILLISSAVYQLTSFKYIDSIGTLALSYFAFKEGKECFKKARSEKHCGCNLFNGLKLPTMYI